MRLEQARWGTATTTPRWVGMYHTVCGYRKPWSRARDSSGIVHAGVPLSVTYVLHAIRTAWCGRVA